MRDLAMEGRGTGAGRKAGQAEDARGGTEAARERGRMEAVGSYGGKRVGGCCQDNHVMCVDPFR